VSSPVIVPGFLRKARETSADGLAWLDRLPDLVADVSRRWGVEIIGLPYEGGMCGWVAPVRHSGAHAVLKVTWPHPEAATEAAALRWWDGAGAVRLLAEDSEAWAMLLEACEPGTPLREAGLPTERGLALGAELLNALWTKGIPDDTVTPFASMLKVCDGWADGAAARVEKFGPALLAFGADPGILSLGIELLRTLPRSAPQQVVVHGDFNPGNVLAARRMPYLAIDPKPMVGDPAYDPWPLVAQLDWPFRRSDAAQVVRDRIRRLAERLDLAPERIAAWGIGRDVEGGLWAAEDGHAADGAKWIRSATIVAPMLA
jgi:streptomycin 6-kinase